MQQKVLNNYLKITETFSMFEIKHLKPKMRNFEVKISKKGQNDVMKCSSRHLADGKILNFLN